MKRFRMRRIKRAVFDATLKEAETHSNIMLSDIKVYYNDDIERLTVEISKEDDKQAFMDFLMILGTKYSEMGQ